ncbi:RebB protein [Exilibacterium tricleocarpae]|uniref:RebB protein n=1 Tax=Exilibacterium tricleocarpae TaxID=2591008 RepID=A0A545TM33_9GAMM|nr:RebB family R body protein [Exilibacterium tricleocarpae]TQV78228.1 RebB protein [Exilibacterium tricleocarpae]
MDEVNKQAVDAIATVNAGIIAQSPAVAMANLYQTLSNSASMMSINAVYAQQQTNIQFQAATTLGIKKMFSVL